MLSQSQISTLEGIGFFKQMLPLGLRGWCNDLGLYVQMQEDRVGTTLKAGGKFIARVHLWQEYESPSYPAWEVKKYKSGDWEALIEPTYQLTCWLHDRYEKGETEIPSTVSQLRAAIARFRRTGVLELPGLAELMGGAERS